MSVLVTLEPARCSDVAFNWTRYFSLPLAVALILNEYLPLEDTFAVARVCHAPE